MRAIAERLDAQARPETAPDLAFVPPPRLRRFLCGLAQAAVMPFFLGVVTAQWLGVYIAYILLSPENGGFFSDLATVVVVYLAINVATLVLGVAGKWLVIGRTKPGRYPLWGVYYYRCWLASHFAALVPGAMLQGTPVMRFYLRMLGAKIGGDNFIGNLSCGAVDLVTIGSGNSIGNAAIANSEVVGNELIIGEVRIGDDVYIGSSTVIGHGVVVEDHAELADLPSVAPGLRIGRCEKWDGSPAAKTGMVDLSALPRTRKPRRRAGASTPHSPSWRSCSCRRWA